MAENQGNDLEVRIGGDVSGFEAAANAAVGHLDDLEKKVVAGTAEIDKRTQALAKADARYAEQLKTRYDPVYAAQKRYLAELEKIRVAEQLGALNAEQTEAAIQRALMQRTGAIQRVIGANNALAVSNVAAARSSGRFGNAIQQAGFQVGDFAVQVASGSGVLRPLIQQGTQLISMFGPWGAVIGAAGAVVGALATSLWDLGDATDEQTSAQKKWNDALDLSNELLLTSDELAKKNVDDKVRDAKATLQKAIAQETENVAVAQRLLLRRQELEAFAAASAAPGITIDTSDLDKIIEESTKKINDFNERFAKLEDPSNLGFNRDKRRKAQEDADKEEEKRLKKIADGYADAAAQQDKDRLAAIKRGEEIIRQDNERAKKFEKYLTDLETENELLGVSEKQRRLQIALMEAQEKKGTALTEAERQRVQAAMATGEAFRQQQAVAEELERGFERAFDRIGNAVTTTFVEGKEAALKWRNVVGGALSELAQEFIKLAALNPLKNALFGTNYATLGGFDFFGLFGGGGSPGYGGLDYGSYAASGIGYVGPSAFHTGGIVGKDTGLPRVVANDVFTRAPRFHSGLMPDEFPAILQKGEGVFTQAQMKALGGGGVTIIDQRGTNAPPIEQSRDQSGRLVLTIRQEIQKATPGIVDLAAADVLDRVQRGGMYAAGFR